MGNNAPPKPNNPPPSRPPISALGKAAEALTQALERASVVIGQIGFITTAEVPLRQGYKLAFAYNRLFITKGLHSLERLSFARASLALRIAAAEAIPRLVLVLQGRSVEEADDVEGTIERVMEFLKRLEACKNDDDIAQLLLERNQPPEAPSAPPTTPSTPPSEH